MEKPNRIFTTSLWCILVLVMVVVLGSGLWDQRNHRSDAESLKALFDVPEFSLTDQNKKTVSDKDMRGHTWVCDFIFTRCPGPCPVLSSNMARLQKELSPSVRLVSFTVDPEFDTPATLKTYGKVYGADDSRWKFLTGTPDAMAKIASGMNVAAQQASQPVNIQHGTVMLLVDDHGKIRGIYHPEDENFFQKLKQDSDALVQEGGRR